MKGFPGDGEKEPAPVVEAGNNGRTFKMNTFIATIAAAALLASSAAMAQSGMTGSDRGYGDMQDRQGFSDAARGSNNQQPLNPRDHSGDRYRSIWEGLSGPSNNGNSGGGGGGLQSDPGTGDPSHR